MNRRFPFGTATFLVLLGGILLGTGGCRKRHEATGLSQDTKVVVAPELEINNLDAFPGAVYRSQANSPIHWQPWTKVSMERAKAAHRLVFAVVVLPQQPHFLSVLAAMDKDPALVASINDNYVPVLVDGDAAREVGILTADLCAEREMPVQVPLFLWLTSEANPVAWIPATNPAGVADLFYQADAMIHQSWKESHDYVTNNSRNDNAGRRERITQRKTGKAMSKEPAADATRGIRQLASYYDSYSHSFDEAGGLFPAGSLDLLATTAIQPGVSPEIQARCLEVTRDLLADLLPSAMFDPLEGGVFSARRGASWKLPSFQWDSVSQARVSVALFDSYRATGNQEALDKALGIIAFAEKTFETKEGLFAVGLAGESDAPAWLWSIDEIEQAIPAEDAAWWIKATGMTSLGNISSDVDPQRVYFRSNSIGMGKSVAQLAADVGQPITTFALRYESVRKKLLQVRNARVGPVSRDEIPHAGSTFRMVSAYAAAYGATGNADYRTKAVALLEKARGAFADGPRLRVFSSESPPSVGEGRAFLYGLAMQAALDVSAVTSDDKWLVWCEDLATTAEELFTDGASLKECPADAQIIDLPITDLIMLFDDSTAGLISFAECRLADRKRPLLASFSELATPLPVFAATSPVLHTDLLQATLAREFKVSVVVPDDAPAALKTAVERLPIRMVQRRSARAEDKIPAGSVMLIFSDGRSLPVATAAALQEAVLPSPGKS